MAVPQATVLPIGKLLHFPTRRTSELVLLRAIEFQALCEHHLLPVNGVVRIGYVPGENQLSHAEFTRVVDACAGGIQDQQRMTTRIGLWLHHQLAPRGLAVLAEGVYACTPVRDGAPLQGPTTTLAFYGSLRQNADEQRDFISLTGQELRKEHHA